MNAPSPLRADNPSLHHRQPDSQSNRSASVAAVGEHLQDEQRELYIRHCAEQLLASWKRWETHGFFADRGDADYWLMRMHEAQRQRSPAKQAALLAEIDARIAAELGVPRL